GQHRRAGRECQHREALERAGRLAEEIDVDAIRAARVLVERKDHDVAAIEQRHDAVERAPLADNAEAGSVEPAGDERIEPVRLDRPAHEVEPPTDFRIILDACDSRDFPVAEMTGQHQYALAAPNASTKTSRFSTLT